MSAKSDMLAFCNERRFAPSRVEEIRDKRVFLYVKAHRSDGWETVECSSIEGAVNRAFQYSANPAYRVVIDGREVANRKWTRAENMSRGGKPKIIQNAFTRLSVKADFDPDFILVRTKGGGKKRVRRAVPPMVPKEYQHSPVKTGQRALQPSLIPAYLPADLRDKAEFVDHLAAVRAKEAKSMDAYDLGNARRAMSGTGPSRNASYGKEPASIRLVKKAKA